MIFDDEKVNFQITQLNQETNEAEVKQYYLTRDEMDSLIRNGLDLISKWTRVDQKKRIAE